MVNYSIVLMYYLKHVNLILILQDVLFRHRKNFIDMIELTCFLVLCGCIYCQAENLHHLFIDKVKEIESRVNCITRISIEKLETDRNIGKICCGMQLVLKGFYGGGDFYIRLWKNGKRYDGVGILKKLNNATHPLKVSLGDIDVSDKTITSELNILIRPDGSNLFMEEQFVISVPVKLRFIDGKIEGEYNFLGTKEFMPRTSGIIEGRVLTHKTFRLFMDIEPEFKFRESLNEYELYSIACWYTACLNQLYVYMVYLGYILKNDIASFHKVYFYLPIWPVLRICEKGDISQGKKRNNQNGTEKPTLEIDINMDMELQDKKEISVHKKKEDVSPYLQERLKTINTMLSYIRELEKILNEYPDSIICKKQSYEKLKKSCPLFGPWFGDEPLIKAGDIEYFTLESNTVAKQRWRHVSSWYVINPVTFEDITTNTCAIFGLFLDKEAQYFVDGEECNVVIPYHKSLGDFKEFLDLGNNQGGYILFSKIMSEVSTSLWASISFNGKGELWINRLLVMGISDNELYNPALFKINILKGTNELVVKLLPNTERVLFCMKLCTVGEYSGELETKWHRIRADYETWQDPYKGVECFRGNSMAYYPSHSPVTAWDIERGINVLWRFRCLDYSKSQPVINGDLIFTQEEPHFIVCINKNTGQLVWRKDFNVLRAISEKIYEENSRLWSNYMEIVEKIWEKEDQKSVPDELKKESKRRYNVWFEHLTKHCTIPPKLVWDNSPSGPWVGYTFATPVTKGKYVWVKGGTGATACFDTNGILRWIVHTIYPGGEEALCSSPLLVGDPESYSGRLIVKSCSKREKDKPVKPDVLYAYSPLTGELIWSNSVYESTEPATPVIMRITDGEEWMDVIVTSGGTVLRIDDGFKLIKFNTGWSSSLGATAYKDEFYRIGWKYGERFAHRLVMLDRNTCGWFCIWKGEPIGCAGGWVYHNGYLYALSGTQFGGPFRILDSCTGKAIKRNVNVGMMREGVWGDVGKTDSYVPTVAAGDKIFIATRGDRERKKKWTAVTVIQLAPYGRIIAHNRIEAALQSPPVFDGERIYYRNERYLTCFGYTGEEGIAYEAEQNAKLLFADLTLEPPHDDDKYIKITPFGTDISKGLREFESTLMDRQQWFWGGPFDEDITQIVKNIELIFSLDKDKKELCLDSRRKIIFKPVTKDMLTNSSDLAGYRGPVVNLDCLSLSSPYFVLFFADISFDYNGILRIHYPGDISKIWINNIPVESDTRLFFFPGVYRFLALVEVKNLKKDNYFGIWFTESTDVTKEREEWKKSVEISLSILNAVIKHCHGSIWAEKARICLENYRKLCKEMDF